MPDRTSATCWWDYKWLTPDDRTVACTYYYALAMMRLNERVMGTAHLNVLKGFDINNPAGWTWWKTMERVRRWCDERGLSYDTYWELATEAWEALKYRNRYMNVFAGAAIAKAVEEALAKREEMFLSRHPYYQPAAFRGCPLQVAYRAWVKQQAAKRYGVTKGRAVALTILKEAA